MISFDSDFSMTIGGKAVHSKATIDVVNPATGNVFAAAPDCSDDELDAAVFSAQQAFKSWKEMPLSERQALLRKAADVLETNAPELARLFTLEQGRPLSAAKDELLGAAYWLRAYSEMSPPDRMIEDTGSQSIEIRYAPVGTVCAIAPWNFPVTLAIWKVAPALVAGNTIVLKPSPYTPLCTLKIAELLRGIFPDGVLNVVSGGDSLGPRMTAHSGFAKISFTGSTNTGKSVMASAASGLKRLTLELGGNDAAIILPDVDIDAVAQEIFFGAFFNTAQICVATKRLYVHEEIYEQLRDKLVQIARAIKVGDGFDDSSVLGPVQNERQFERVRALISNAAADGLNLIEGAPVPNRGYFIPVTIVDNPPENSAVVQEEAFGPVLPILKFSSIEDVITRANASEYGLAGSIWSNDTDEALRIARRLETGTVWINQNLQFNPKVPFAGWKQSGSGIENGMEGLLEYMIPQVTYLKKPATKQPSH